jgi:hypothetical protein
MSRELAKKKIDELYFIAKQVFKAGGFSLSSLKSKLQECYEAIDSIGTLQEYIQSVSEAYATSPEKRTDEQKRLIRNVENSPKLS